MDKLTLSPFESHVWSVKYESLDGCDASMPSEADVISVLAHGCTPDDWDGYAAAAVLVLRDGRFMGWSLWWGPTGSGLCCDAAAYFASSLDTIIWQGLDVMGRELCGYPKDRPE